jgi:pectate lyase
MGYNMITKTAVIAAIIGCFVSVAGAIPAFPGAEGYGAVATGGRGGVVCEVTNLNDSGTGSLRAALLQTTTRTIVFRVSGTIHLNSDISIGVSNSNLTIAGQTAPGDGICIANGNLNISKCNNVIIRYIRCRIGDQWPDGTENGDDDAIWGRYGSTIILDHVTASWSIDEAFSFYVNTNFTAQWCLISESLRYSHHVKGAHGYGGIWGSTNSSWHHNLLAHHSSRNPRIEGDVANNVDLRNNVIYNWTFNSCYGGEKATVNIVNCYYKYGPSTESDVRDRIANPSAQKDAASALIVPHAYGQWYVSGNYVYGSTSVTADNWLGMDPEVAGEQSLCKSTTPFPVAMTHQVTTQSAQDAYNSVLNDAGCSLVRDSVDTRIVNEVRTGTATYGGTTGAGLGIIDSQTTVGGWPTLNSIPAPADSDHDGMPDAWEIPRGLNPSDAADRNTDRDLDGYTNLEEYLNWLCTPDAKADIDRSCVIDLRDFAVFAKTWMTQYGDPDWNPACDISTPPDNHIDAMDLGVLIDNWLYPNGL